MSDKAGLLFKCVCCSDPAPESEAHYDQQFGGPICTECRRNSLWAIAYLKKEGIDRPFAINDINNHNNKRFSI